MCVNVLKKGCAQYLSTLLDNCLPHTPYDKIVEHAMSFERKNESIKVEKKPCKRKSEEIDLIEDDPEDQKFRMKIAKMKETTRDRSQENTGCGSRNDSQYRSARPAPCVQQSSQPMREVRKYINASQLFFKKTRDHVYG